jgi:hypothetical protein
MFLYFGYGSNINLVSLRAKGVDPVASERAILRGWRLRFNVQHWFRHEGGVGNIEPSPNPDDFVEGMVHTCYDEHLAPLDAVESYGLGYDRIMAYPSLSEYYYKGSRRYRPKPAVYRKTSQASYSAR